MPSLGKALDAAFWGGLDAALGGAVAIAELAEPLRQSVRGPGARIRLEVQDNSRCRTAARPDPSQSLEKLWSSSTLRMRFGILLLSHFFDRLPSTLDAQVDAEMQAAGVKPEQIAALQAALRREEVDLAAAGVPPAAMRGKGGVFRARLQ